MFSISRLPPKSIGRNFGQLLPESQEMATWVATTTPTQVLPSYIIPGNLFVIPIGPMGSWEIQIYFPEGYSAAGRQNVFNGLMDIYRSDSGYSISIKGSSWQPIINNISNIPITNLKVESTQGGNRILFEQIQISPFAMWNLDVKKGFLYGTVLGIAFGGREIPPLEIEGRKRPVEMFVPLQTRSSSTPYIDPGLTIVENAQEILMQQGVSKQPVVAAPLHPSPYIPFGNIMVIPVNNPHGLWKISYVVGGYTNYGQLEFAEVQGKIIGRMNVSGGMLYGSSGWEPISDIVFGDGILTKTISFIRNYTRQKWEGIISGYTVSGTYGGGPSAGGGTWNGEKEPIEIFVPTDIKEYTEKIIVTKEMPLATLIPTETVSGKPTGQVVVEEGFAPTKEQAKQIDQISLRVDSVATQTGPGLLSISPIAEPLSISPITEPLLGDNMVGLSSNLMLIFLIGGGILLLSKKGIFGKR